MWLGAQVIMQQRLPKELLQSSLRPILVNLAHYKNLNIPLLQVHPSLPAPNLYPSPAAHARACACQDSHPFTAQKGFSFF